MEFLKEHLSEELYNQLESALKGNDKVKLANLAGGDYVDKGKYKNLETQLAQIKDQLSEANKQIEGFKEMDIDGIKKAADEWKTKYETAEKEYKAKVSEMEFDNLLSSKLADVKFTSEYAKKGVFDEIKGKGLKVDNGNIIGFDEVFNSIREAQPTAFESDDPKPQFTTHMETGDRTDINAARAIMGLPPEK